MPVYPFTAIESQEYREVFFPMDLAPSVGSQVIVNGEKLRRLFSPHLTATSDDNRVFGAKFPYASDALPRYTRPIGTDVKFDKVGRPVIRNKRHEADIASRMDMQVGGVEQWGE